MLACTLIAVIASITTSAIKCQTIKELSSSDESRSDANRSVSFVPVIYGDDSFAVFARQVIANANLTGSDIETFSKYYSFKMYFRQTSDEVFAVPLTYSLGILAIVDHSLAIVPLFSQELLRLPNYNYHRVIIVHELMTGILRLFSATCSYYFYNKPALFRGSLFLNVCKQTFTILIYVLENPLVTVVFALSIERFLALFVPLRFKFAHHRRTFWIAYGFAICVKCPVSLTVLSQYTYDISPDGNVTTSQRKLPDIISMLIEQVMRGVYDTTEALFLTLFTIGVAIGLLRLRKRTVNSVHQMDAKSIERVNEATRNVQAAVLALGNAIPYSINRLTQLTTVRFLTKANNALPVTVSKGLSLVSAMKYIEDSIHLSLGSNILQFLMAMCKCFNFTMFLLLSKQFRSITTKKYHTLRVSLRLLKPQDEIPLVEGPSKPPPTKQSYQRRQTQA